VRHDELYIADLVDSTRAVREYLDGISREHWDQDRVLRDAVLYRLLLLGEIASALPDALRDRYPEVAWRQIRAFRNLAVHKYFSVDWAVVWQISREEVPVLEEQAMDIMRAAHPSLPARLGRGGRSPYRTASISRSRRLLRWNASPRTSKTLVGT
jgi:uncharacterized protein with HEPN domain